MKPRSLYDEIYAAVRKVPRGKVATYGQIAAYIGRPRSARMVGWALHHLAKRPDPTVPWQRVLNREGVISIVNLTYPADEQALLLRKEGVIVRKRNDAYWVDLDRFLWKT
ncbi:MAG: MGMT family protein [Patescibacteria group bacterium]|jgi:methylated-DNA-protein-cysteine methyltransferase-like protein